MGQNGKKKGPRKYRLILIAFCLRLLYTERKAVMEDFKK